MISCFLPLFLIKDAFFLVPEIWIVLMVLNSGCRYSWIMIVKCHNASSICIITSSVKCSPCYFFRKQHVISRPGGAFRFSLLTCYAHSTWRCVQCVWKWRREFPENEWFRACYSRGILASTSKRMTMKQFTTIFRDRLHAGKLGRREELLFTFSKPNRILWHSREISEEVANPANCILRWAISTVRTEVVSPLLWHCSLNAQHRKKVFYGTSF